MADFIRTTFHKMPSLFKSSWHRLSHLCCTRRNISSLTPWRQCGERQHWNNRHLCLHRGKPHNMICGQQKNSLSVRLSSSVSSSLLSSSKLLARPSLVLPLASSSVLSSSSSSFSTSLLSSLTSRLSSSPTLLLSSFSSSSSSLSSLSLSSMPSRLSSSATLLLSSFSSASSSSSSSSSLSSPELSEREIEDFILENMEVCEGDHLTPEIKLHLMTPNCRYWHGGPEDCPIPHPYWAFYWPGGQALTRYVLDNPGLVCGNKVLDLGSGSGASAIAAVLGGATKVLANDICQVSSIAIRLNAKINNVDLAIGTDNLIGQKCDFWDLILVGDMFYDEEITKLITDWLKIQGARGTKILIGDPGRMYLLEEPVFNHLEKVAEYEMPENCRQENNGLTHTCVWEFKG